MIQQTKLTEEECLHPWVKVNQAGRPLPPKSLSILVGLTVKLFGRFGLFLEYFCVANLERFVLGGIGRNVKI